MSRSVSAPSSVTNTSPCWNGFIVPGSTFRYGSSFCMTTRRPRAVSRLPRLEAVRPLPSEEATPPVTKMCRVSRAVAAKAGSRGGSVGSCRPARDAPSTGFHGNTILDRRPFRLVGARVTGVLRIRAGAVGGVIQHPQGGQHGGGNGGGGRGARHHQCRTAEAAGDQRGHR